MFRNHEKYVMKLIAQNLLLRHTKQSGCELGPYTKINCVSQNLIFDKCDGADFKHDNIFFKMPAQKYANKTFLVPTFGIFILGYNFTILFQIWQ